MISMHTCPTCPKDQECPHVKGPPVSISKLYPTGTCFDDALDTLARWLKEGRHHHQKLMLVHGICLAPRDTTHAGDRFSHAWLEVDDKHVWQCGIAPELPGARIEYAVDLAEFYEEFRVEEATKYTPREAAEINHRTNSFGPWLPQYLALIKEERRVFWPVGMEPS